MVLGLAPNGESRLQLSVALITRLNLWWSEATRAVLAEESARLKISAATLDEACEMVVKSCHSSLVRMAKQFDAEFQVPVRAAVEPGAPRFAYGPGQSRHAGRMARPSDCSIGRGSREGSSWPLWTSITSRR